MKCIDLDIMSIHELNHRKNWAPRRHSIKVFPTQPRDVIARVCLRFYCGLLPFGCARNTSPRKCFSFSRFLISNLVGCTNHPNWLFICEGIVALLMRVERKGKSQTPWELYAFPTGNYGLKESFFKILCQPLEGTKQHPPRLKTEANEEVS